MNARRLRLALAAVAIGLVAVGAVLAASNSQSSRASARPSATSEGDMPAALASHLAKLSQSIPGNGGEPAGESSGPGTSTAALEEFAQLAYPKKDVPLSSLQAARSAFQTARARALHGLAGGNHPAWQQVGPETALYQFTPFRDAHSYVPQEYAAAGRTTDLVIDPNCNMTPAHGRHGGKCRMWITPAGGGVWRTDNALAPNPNWQYLAGSFGINAAGTITHRPERPELEHALGRDG